MAQYSDSSKTETFSHGNSGSTNIDDNAVKSITNEIICVLQLEDDQNKDQIVNNLLENGRQSLVKYRHVIEPKLYEAEMNGKNGQLMSLLKQYLQQLYIVRYRDQYDWFDTFLKDYESGDNRDLYDNVLTRTAEYGNKCMKDCPLLSIVLQLIFKLTDDQCLNESNVFNGLWTTITDEGLTSVRKYFHLIDRKQLEEQNKKKQKVLFRALREYYRPKLFQLLKESNIRDQDDLYNLVLYHVAKDSWQKGLEAVKDEIVPKYFAILLEKIRCLENQHSAKSSVRGNNASPISTNKTRNPTDYRIKASKFGSNILCFYFENFCH